MDVIAESEKLISCDGDNSSETASEVTVRHADASTKEKVKTEVRTTTEGAEDHETASIFEEERHEHLHKMDTEDVELDDDMHVTDQNYESGLL